MTAESLSARRAWIEISPALHDRRRGEVALRKESVDRNRAKKAGGTYKYVALRKESVDRNIEGAFLDAIGSVALRKESVDRNFCWKERETTPAPVALRKESVDRNCSMNERFSKLSCRSPQGERG